MHFVKPKSAIIFSLFVFLSVAGLSQATVRGFIKDSEDGEPVLFVPVFLEGTEYGTTTDVNGYYSISKVPGGTYTLIIQSAEHELVKETITIGKDEVLLRSYLLTRKSTELGPVIIDSESSDQRTQTRVSVETIRPQDIKKIPSFGGQPDLVQVLQTLPGFITTGDQGGQIYIRGGSPVQNKVLLDGMIVYNAFHSIGLFSVFDTDIISNADVYSGGFGAQFGGRVSSVMDISTRDGNKKELSGKIGANPIGARILIEGPLKKLSENGSGISYMLSAKTSYLEQTSKTIYNYINNGDGLPFNYTDLYGKISFGGAGSKFNLFGFSFGDDVTKYQALSKLGWNNGGAGGNFVVTPGGSSVLINGNFAVSRYKITLKEESVPDRFSSINSFNFGLDFKYVLGEDELKYGVEVVGFGTDYETFNSLGVSVQQEQNTTEISGYFTWKISSKKWLIEPGLRLQYYGSLSRLSPEPRFAAKFLATERLRFKCATGLYSQNLLAANSDRDVVNLFYGFLSGPDNLPNSFTDSNGEEREVKHPLQTAIHYIAGFEFDLTERWNLNVEGYYRDFTQLTGMNRNKIFPDTPDMQDRPEALRKDFVIETGRASGLDIVMKYEDKHKYFWFVYSLGNVDRWDGFRWYDPVFDRRHNINLVANYNFGKKNSWELSARWNLGSGLPFTQTQGYYQEPSVENGIATDYTISNSSELGIIFTEQLNGGRLPYYHRMDMNIRKTVDLSKKIKLEMNAGITNVYSRANVFYIDRITGKRVDQLPFMPSIGIDMSF